MRNWRSGDITANGISLHYTRTGGDGPPLVLAHGMADSGLCWSRVAGVLETEYDVIMPDARSHGQSGRSAGDYDSEIQASDLAGFIEALELGRPVVGGHSMGAMTTVFLAASRPDLLRAAILEDPPFWPATTRLSDEEVESRLVERRRGLESDQAGGREVLLARGRADNPLWADEEFEPWVDSKMALDTVALPRLSQTLNWREALARIEAPTLLLTGDPERGAIVTPKIAHEAADIQPLVHVVRIAGAGHSIRREQFKQYLEAVGNFLAGVRVHTAA
jgi:N-formylmaleamate deformylase